MGGKTIWIGREGEHVNVETLALQHYEEKGYKGYIIEMT
jgi:fanconi-associated nuclease 1